MELVHKINKSFLSCSEQNKMIKDLKKKVSASVFVFAKIYANSLKEILVLSLIKVLGPSLHLFSKLMN